MSSPVLKLNVYPNESLVLIPSTNNPQELELVKTQLSSLLKTTSTRLLELQQNQQSVQNWIKLQNSVPVNSKLKIKIREEVPNEQNITNDAHSAAPNEDSFLENTSASVTVDISNLGIIKITPKINHESVETLDPSQIKATRAFDEPAVIVGADYSKLKPVQNQIPAVQFWNYCEQIFRSLNENDLKLLKPSILDEFNIEPLGKHYLQQWMEEDVLAYEGFDTQNSKFEYLDTEDATTPGELSLGKWTEKLVSLLIPEGVVPDSRMIEDELQIPPKTKHRTSAELLKLEERIKKELSFLGLLPKKAKIEANDEVSREIVKLQAELQKQVALNNQRKELLLPIAEKWMANQEYNVLLDEINKNIQSSYSKRYLPQKKSKKRPFDSKGLPEGMYHSIKSRSKLIHDVGDVFFQQTYLDIPESLFEFDDV